jgi:hypothetical protein
VQIRHVRKSSEGFLIAVLERNCKSENCEVENFVLPRRSKRNISDKDKTEQGKQHIRKIEDKKFQAALCDVMKKKIAIINLENNPLEKKQKRAK